MVAQYFCDSCEKEIGDRKHILVENCTQLGYVAPPKWLVAKESRRHKRTYQFCDVLCLATFLAK